MNKDKVLPMGLYKAATYVLEALCKWCGKSDTDDCAKCQILDAWYAVDSCAPEGG